MMLESILAFIKTLPTWLSQVVEVLIVAVVFMTVMTFLAGVWCGIRIIGKRASSIQEIQFIPPRVVFKDK
jgi:hypothetical protein